MRTEIRHFHLFCGLGGSARGFNNGHAKIGQYEAEMRCIGGIDVLEDAISDFNVIAGVKGTCLDLFSREQYIDWHGLTPPPEWKEVTPEDIRKAAGGERPHIVFSSPPCKGFSSLLNAKKSKSQKYQALNKLTLRGIWLSMEAWKDDPPEFFLLENVPHIKTRGRALLEQIEALLEFYGYAVAETTHNCGEIGGLAQSRRRFLLVARHKAKVPPFLYEPPKRPMRGVGEVLGRLPLPGYEPAGPLHVMRSLQWKTWVRLALIEAGSDWRSLETLEVSEGILKDIGIVPAFSGGYGVLKWEDPTGALTGRSMPSTGKFSIADPRVDFKAEFGQYGVLPWEKPANTVTGQSAPGGGRYSVADPRVPGIRFGNRFRVTEWDGPASTILGKSTALDGQAVADPRPRLSRNSYYNLYRVVKWDDSSPVITTALHPSNGSMAVADPRFFWDKQHFQRCGHYGVIPWDEPSYSVVAKAKHDNSRFNVADPRLDQIEGHPAPLPELTDMLVAVIEALDGTWHRPFTTLELAALQGLFDPEDGLELTGRSDKKWRERIGNAVPSPAASEIASVMAHTLLLAWSGQTFSLGSTPIWVRELVIGLTVKQEGE